MTKTTDPDGGAAIAEQAYAIYRGMAQSLPPPHWEDLPESRKGAFIFVARFAMLRALHKSPGRPEGRE